MTVVRAEIAGNNGKELPIYSLKTAFGGWISVHSQSALFTGFILLTQTAMLSVCLCFILATQLLCVYQKYRERYRFPVSW